MVFGGDMKTTVMIVLALVVLFVAIVPAISEARGGYYHRSCCGPYYRGGWGYGGAALGGFVAGAIVGSALRPAPVYVAPPPPPPPRAYYYYPPPPPVYVYPY